MWPFASRLLPNSAGTAALALMALAMVAPTRQAQAIEVTCIEASKYKYLYLIFNNDRQLFARTFNIDVRQLPHPEACRAAIITERIEKAERERGDANDFNKLFNMIAQSGGGLATLYLASGGGNIGTGFQLGYLTRMFWLKSYAVDGSYFEYLPDFLGQDGPGTAVNEVPAELQAGWNRYREVTQSLRTIQVAEGAKRRRCASACTFLHVAGIHRAGVSYFHRARRGARPTPATQPGSEPSLSELAEGLHRTEQRVISFYRQMDAGDEAIKTFQETTSLTVVPAPISLMPRYVDDYLRAACGSRKPPRREREREYTPQSAEEAQFQNNASDPAAATESARDEPSLSDMQFQSQYRPPATPPGYRPPPATAPPASRPPLHLCFAAIHERERLRQFAKLCQGSCDAYALLRDISVRVRGLVPEDSNPQRSSSGSRQRSFPSQQPYPQRTMRP